MGLDSFGSFPIRVTKHSKDSAAAQKRPIGFNLDFQKSPSSDFIWRASRDFVARGQKRLAPLAKRSTCSKSSFNSI